MKRIHLKDHLQVPGLNVENEQHHCIHVEHKDFGIYIFTSMQANLDEENTAKIHVTYLFQ